MRTEQVHQKTDQANERLQVFQLSIGNTARHRSRAHDPQTTIQGDGPIRIPAIRGARWITVSRAMLEPAIYQNLRQNLSLRILR